MVIDTFLERHAPAVADLTREVATWLATERPDLTLADKTGWGTLNYHHKRAGFVLALYPNADHLSVIFQQGRLLSSPLLTGDTKQVRWLELRPGEAVPWDEIGILIVEAIALRA